jgi:hypothetical protein
MNRKSTESSKFAIICQSMYLANLLLLPGVFFFILLYYYVKYRSQKAKKSSVINKGNMMVKVRGLGKIHLMRSIQLSVLAGVVLVIIPSIVIFFSSQQEASIMVALIYFVTLHASFVLIGMFNLSRAMAKKLPLF